MFIKCKTTLFAGLFSVFAPSVAKTLIGKENNGFKVIDARQTSPDTIILTLEVEIPDFSLDVESYSIEQVKGSLR